MESRLIHISSSTYLSKVKWELPFEGADSEWVYFGLGNELDLALVEKVIDQHLQSEELMLDLGRHRSRQINSRAMIREFGEIIAVSGFVLWDTNFRSVIQFGQIGIFRKGVRPNLIAP